MSILRTSWFYTRLILTDLQFLSWFFWQQYFTTQVVGVSLAWFLLAGLLVTRQLLIWQLANVSTSPAPSTEISDNPLEWRLTTIDQLNKLCDRLNQAHQLQPTHRDILVNLSFCRAAQGDTALAEDWWRTAQKLDPNATIFTTKSVVQPKNN